MSRAATAAARLLGRKGGQATGAAKRRTPQQYREIQARAVHSRRVTAAVNALVRAGDARPDVEDSIRARWGDDVLRAALAEA